MTYSVGQHTGQQTVLHMGDISRLKEVGRLAWRLCYVVTLFLRLLA
jgi:hypothetical protein